MQKSKAILFIFILGISFFPWQLVCSAHPFGHDHDPLEGPSPCELRRMYQGENPALWPPMDCEHVYVDMEDYQQTNSEKAVYSSQPVLFALFYYNLVCLDPVEEKYFLPPDPHCRSGTGIANRPLRAPPLS